MNNLKVQNKVNFLKIGATHFTGKIDEYVSEFFNNRVLSDFAKNEIFAEAEDALKNPRDDGTIVGEWSGEFWGKLEISGCRVYEYTKDEKLLDFLKQSAHRVLSYAREDGYVNSYKDSSNVFAPSAPEARALVGWDCDWNWNIWCRKYTLWGLIECGVLTGDSELIDGAHKLAVQLIDELKNKGININDTGTASFHGVPSASIMKPMILLYKITNDKKLLDFCLSIADDWDRADGRCPNLIRNALSRKPVHEWYPSSQNWAKAYETMSCYEGLTELYRVTGNEKYLNAVQAFYELLKEHESNVLGSVGFGDIFANAAKIENAYSEPCDVIHWIRLCTELFSLTGKPCYMDSVEKAFYNAYLAGFSDEGKWGMRRVRTSGRHAPAWGQSSCKYNHCCVDNMPRGYLNVTSSTVMESANEQGVIYINQYCPFESVVCGENVKISCSDGYLSGGKITFTIDSKIPLMLNIRIPSFAGKNAKVDGISQVTPGSFSTLNVNPGITEIHADFDFSPVLHDMDKIDMDKIHNFLMDDFNYLFLMAGIMPEISKIPITINVLNNGLSECPKGTEPFAQIELSNSKYVYITISDDPKIDMSQIADGDVCDLKDVSNMYDAMEYISKHHKLLLLHWKNAIDDTELIHSLTYCAENDFSDSVALEHTFLRYNKNILTENACSGDMLEELLEMGNFDSYITGILPHIYATYDGSEKYKHHGARAKVKVAPGKFIPVSISEKSRVYIGEKDSETMPTAKQLGIKQSEYEILKIGMDYISKHHELFLSHWNGEITDDQLGDMLYYIRENNSTDDNDDTYEDYSDKDFRIERWLWEPGETPHVSRDSMMKKQCSYITYGPLLLAQSKKLGASEKDMFDFSSVHGKNYKISAEPDKEIPKNVFLNFKVTLDNGKDKIEKRMCDYASASDSYSNLDDKFFNVYL